LKPERDPDDGATKYKAANAIANGADKASEDQPDKITNQVHKERCFGLEALI